MSEPASLPDPAGAFRALERRLLARRLAALDSRTRALALLLGLCVGGLTFWKVRVPLDGAVRLRGAASGAAWLSAVLAAFAALGGAIAAWRRATQRIKPPGPEWLALPIPPARVARHLLSEARWPAALVFVPALGAIFAAIGLLPPLWLALLAAAFAVLWLEATRAGAAWAWRAGLPHGAAEAKLPALTRALLTPAQAATARTLRAPAWRREPAWRAIARLDLAMSLRRSPARPRLAAALLLLAASALAWLAPAPPAVRRALAFAAFAPACAALGAWAIARTCSDPPAAIRSLPLSWRPLWRARATALLVVLGAVVLLQASLAAALSPGVPIAPVLLWLPAGFALAVLGLQYGLALAPRAVLAENLYFAWLGAGLLSSWLIPFFGWGVLLAALVHSTMRLPRWWQPEVE